MREMLRYHFTNLEELKLALPWWYSRLRMHLPMQGTQVESLVREDPTCWGQLSPCTAATGAVRHHC